MTLLKVGVAILAWSMAQAGGGSVTGTVRLPAGVPAAGVRVAAMVIPGVRVPAGEGAVLARITQTDTNGRYQLEDLPPGRYHIVAGPVATPTFHPGTTAQSAATVFTIGQIGGTQSGVDFAISTGNPPPAAVAGTLPGGLVCCRFYGKTLMEDGSPLPNLPLKVTATGRPVMVNVNGDGSFILGSAGAPPTGPTQFTMDGLPPGLVLKSVDYGPGNFSPGVPIDPRTTVNVKVILGYVPVSTLPRVSVRGKVINVAKELNASALSLTSLLPDGPTVVAPISQDGSYEVSSLPIGAYRVGVRNGAGSAVSWGTPVVISKAMSDLTINLGNSPFPEFEGINPKQSTFTNGKATTITGVMTQKLTVINFNPGQAYFFRMDVKDELTGVVTSWAIHLAKEWHAPKIRVGDMLTVSGTLSTDGTPRLSADPF